MRHGAVHSAPGRPSALHTLRIDRPFVPDLLVRRQPPTAFFYQVKHSFEVDVELRLTNKVSLSSTRHTAAPSTTRRRALPSLNERDPCGRDPSDPDFDPCEPGPEIVDRAEREKERLRLRKLQRRGALVLEVADLREPDPEARLPLQVSLMYNNRFRVEDQRILELLNEPEIVLGIEGWKATLVLRINQASSFHDNQAFRIRIAPKEPLNEWWEQLRSRTGGYTPAGQQNGAHETMAVGRVAVTNSVVTIADEFEYQIRVNGIIDVSRQPPGTWFSTSTYFEFSVALRNSGRLKFPPGIDGVALRCVLMYKDHSLVADQTVLETERSSMRLTPDREGSGEWVATVRARILQPCAWRRHRDMPFCIKVEIADEGLAALAKRAAAITAPITIVAKVDHEAQALKKSGRRLPGTLLPSAEERSKWMKSSIAEQLTEYLLDALDTGDLVEVERCIRAGAPPNSVRNNRSHVANRTAIHLAVQLRSARSVAMLVGLGASPNFVHAHAMHGLSPLAAACLLFPRAANDEANASGQLAQLVAHTDPLEADASARLIRRLIDQGADPAGKCADGETTALNVAAQAGNDAAVEALLLTDCIKAGDAKRSAERAALGGHVELAAKLEANVASRAQKAEKVKKEKKAKLKLGRKAAAAKAAAKKEQARLKALKAAEKKKKKSLSFFDAPKEELTGSAFAARLLRERHEAAFAAQLTEPLARPAAETSRLPLPESLDRGTMWPRAANANDAVLSTNRTAAERDAEVAALRREREKWHQTWKAEKISFVEPTELKLARKVLKRCAADEAQVAKQRAAMTDASRGARSVLRIPFNFEEEERTLKLARLDALGLVRNAVRLQKEGLGPRSGALARSLMLHGEMCAEVAHSGSCRTVKHKRRYLETGAKSLGEALAIFRDIVPSGLHLDRRRAVEIYTDVLVSAGDLGAHYCLDLAAAAHEQRVRALAFEHGSAATESAEADEWKVEAKASEARARAIFTQRERGQMSEEDIRLRRRQTMAARNTEKRARPQVMIDADILRDLLLRPTSTAAVHVVAEPESMSDAVNFCAAILRLRLVGPGEPPSFGEWTAAKKAAVERAAKRAADEEAVMELEQHRALMRHGDKEALIEYDRQKKAAERKAAALAAGEELSDDEEMEAERLAAEAAAKAAESDATEDSSEEEDDDGTDKQNGLDMTQLMDLYDEFVSPGESTVRELYCAACGSTRSPRPPGHR
jgi:hypothetical protein